MPLHGDFDDFFNTLGERNATALYGPKKPAIAILSFDDDSILSELGGHSLCSF